MLKKLAVIMLAAVVLSACAQQEPVQKQRKLLSWQQNMNKKVFCQRSADSSNVNLTAENLSSDIIDGRACYGNANKMCNLRIYQIMTESFRHGAGDAKGVGVSWGPAEHHDGNLRGIIDSLDYIKNTGANAIWMTPIFATNKIDNQDSSYDKLDGTGYFTSDYFKVDPRFGTLTDLKELVKKAHQKGIYVFLDGVFGHAKTNVSTVSPNGNKLVLSRKCIDLGGSIDKMSLMLGTCFDNAASEDFFLEVASYWIKETGIDGWRLDQAYQLPPAEWKKISAEVKKVSSDKSNAYTMNGKKVQPLGYMVGEIWSERPQTIEAGAFTDGALMSAFNFPLRADLVRTMAGRENIEERDACGIAPSIMAADYMKIRGYNKSAMPNMFLTNHDFLRFGDLLQRAGYNEDGVKDESYFDAHRAALSFLAAYSGPITIYYGDETGDDLQGFVTQPGGCGDLCRCDDHVARTNGRVGSTLTPEESALKSDVSKMLSIRAAHPSLYQGVRKHVYSDDSLYIDLKTYNKDTVLYVLNSGVAAREVSISPEAFAKLGMTGNCSLNTLFGAQPDALSVKVPALSGNFYAVKCK